MKAPHLLSGRHAERSARHWLESRGLRHICSNYRCRYGELDLIMLDAGCLVIVEVRYRRSMAFGGALGSVGHAKQAKIQLAAAHYLQRHAAYRHHPVRFDVLAVSAEHGPLAFDWRRRAFYADDG